MTQIPESTVQLLSSFFDIISKTSNDNDAINALKRARVILDDVGLTFEECIKSQNELFKAKQEIADLRAKLENKNIIAIDGFYSFKDLLNLVVSKINGKVHGWQTALIDASQGTEYEIDSTILQNWRHIEEQKNIPTVPAKYFNAISNFVFEIKSASKERYNAIESQAFIIAYDAYQKNPEKLNYSQVANQLSEHLGRKITENSIKGVFDRIKLFRLTSIHIQKHGYENKTEKELVRIVSDAIGRPISLKIVKNVIANLKNNKSEAA
jgi:hypothetical protein